jgi:hypothetical protein
MRSQNGKGAGRVSCRKYVPSRIPCTIPARNGQGKSRDQRAYGRDAGLWQAAKRATRAGIRQIWVSHGSTELTVLGVLPETQNTFTTSQLNPAYAPLHWRDEIIRIEAYHPLPVIKTNLEMREQGNSPDEIETDAQMIRKPNLTRKPMLSKL